ncbi:MAG TPA: hypothetical protein DCZ01_02385 [Elusimicrobia bacterium]|nr:hypothetical protein [Elusimicrobiota bacterium]
MQWLGPSDRPRDLGRLEGPKSFQPSYRAGRRSPSRISDRKTYLKNAYRVLLTRARQGIVIVIPEGSDEDPTRKAEFYDPTFEYLRKIGLPVIS